MIKKILLGLIIFSSLIMCFCIMHANHNRIQPIKRVYLTKEKDVNFFCIDFKDGAVFTPRIHTLRNGVKLILSFNKLVSQPASNKVTSKIIDGCFFEQLGDCSLMVVVLFKGKASYVKNKHTNNSIKIGFKIPKRHTVVIDAGHGGIDPGTMCVTKDFEKNITLVTAVELRNILRASDRYDVVMTRDSDTFVSKEIRKAKIRKSSGEILISLHTDSNNDKNVRGISLYTLPDLNVRAPRHDLSQESRRKYNEILKTSRYFSNILIGYIPNVCKIRNRPCRNADLSILKSGIPAVLIELGCVSNSKDNELLHSQEFRDKTNRAILYALDKYFAEIKDEGAI